MKFSLISDMHVDFPQPKTPYDKLEQVVVVAGDTSNGLEGLKFLRKMQNKGFTVLATEGNHEHYKNRAQSREHFETTRSFHEEFANNAIVEGVPFVLMNGWYRVEHESSWFNYMNDSWNGRLTAKDVNDLCYRDFRVIEKALQGWRFTGQKGVIVTHTAPCTDTLDPKFEGSFSNQWYWNPLMRSLLLEYAEHIHVWCHGHTHTSNEAIVNGVRVVCNPRGYPGENPDWAPLTIEV